MIMFYMKYLIAILSVCYCVHFIESSPQYDMRSLFNWGNGAFVPQPIGYRQGTIDDFLTILKPTTKVPIIKPEVPCIPQQFHPDRFRRSPHLKKKPIFAVFPLNIYEQNVHNVQNSHNIVHKPSYNHYGGYYCGNYKPIETPIHNNIFANIFGGLFSANYDRENYENNDNDNSQNEV